MYIVIVIMTFRFTEFGFLITIVSLSKLVTIHRRLLGFGLTLILHPRHANIFNIPNERECGSA